MAVNIYWAGPPAWDLTNIFYFFFRFGQVGASYNYIKSLTT